MKIQTSAPRGGSITQSIRKLTITAETPEECTALHAFFERHFDPKPPARHQEGTDG